MPRYNGAGIGGSDGYVVIDDPGLPGGRVEYDTYQCAHCNAHFRRHVGAAPPGMCRLCMRPVCNRQECHSACVPFEAKLEASEGSRTHWHEVDLRRAHLL